MAKTSTSPDVRARRKSARLLEEYETKHDLRQTAEPAALVPAEPRQGERRFVIQKHDSEKPHFDLRLEMKGVLKSWAVPKGLPLRSGERRLAIQVEDHPLKYARFQGVIPPGNYGAGTVTIWDSGCYESQDDHPLEAWEQGKLQFRLHGHRFEGTWTLLRLPMALKERQQWVILKNKASLKRSERSRTTSAKETGKASKAPRSANHNSGRESAN